MMTHQEAALAGDAHLAASVSLKSRMISFVNDAVRYGAASAIALVVDWGLLVILTRRFGFHYQTASLVSFSAGLVVAYSLSVIFVFRHRRRVSVRTEFFGFVLSGVIGLAITQLLLFGMVDSLHIAAEIAKGPAAVFVFCANFLMRRHFLFSPKVS